MLDNLKPLLGKLCAYSQQKMGFSHPPKLFLRNDSKNSQNTLGKTAFYDPQEKSVTLFIHNRHPKDILRSFAHELVHHTQNLRGDLSPEKMTSQGPGYAQECPHMRKMEKEAYLKGNMCFRDWEDEYKLTLQESIFLKENKTMTTKITKEFLKETIRKTLSELRAPTWATATIAQAEKGMAVDPGRLAAAKKAVADAESLTAKMARKAFFDKGFKQAAADSAARKKAAARTAGIQKANAQAAAGRELANAQRAAQKQIAAQAEKAIEAAEDKVPQSLEMAQIAAQRFGPKHPSAEFLNTYRKEVAAIKADKAQKAAAISKAQSPEQVAAILDGSDTGSSIAGSPVGGTYPSKGPSALDKLKKAAGSVGSSIKAAGSALGSAVGAMSDAEISRLGKQQLRFNKMLGMDMSKLQRMVGAQETGQYDLQTAAAIKNFQTDIGAKPDGVFGAGTYRAAKAKNKLEEAGCSTSHKRKDKKLEEAKCCGMKGCPGPGEPHSGKFAIQENEELEEGKGEKCTKCEGKGCDHCDGKGYHKLEENEELEEAGFPDLTGDGKVTQADILKGRGVELDDDDENDDETKDESKIQTPEQENTLYESRFAPRNNRLFEKLVKEWTK